ncbi:MAG: methyltransferase domain-containing protein [Acidimicrobiia bacterium]|nr:methyltransferase domain-containing protein [Acidimicrobiia bacterium]
MGDRGDKEAKQAMAGVFSRAAPHYDRVVTSFFDRLGTDLVDFVGLGPGTQVLDVACGRGATVFPASARVGEEGRVVGIDLAPGMIDVLRDEVERLGISNVESRVADAETIPYPDDSFDAVLCGFALFFFPDSHRALTEFHRVLTPGGRLGISTFTPMVSEGLAWFGELVRDALGMPSRGDETIQFDQPDQLKDALNAAGFSDIEIQRQSCKVSVLGADHFWEWMWSIGIRGMLEHLDESTAGSVRRAAATHLDNELGPPPYSFDADSWLTRAVRV